MVVLCYHNGALGHTVGALLDCCTKEGTKDFPSFVANQNLHHYQLDSELYKVIHPVCNIQQERSNGNLVVSSSSKTQFGKLLILLMGLKKWVKNIPDLDNPVTYKQYGNDYGDQLEILSLDIQGKVNSDIDWFLDADNVLDITDFWNNPANIANFISDCQLTPDVDRVVKFCRLVAATNQLYYDSIKHCATVVADVIEQKIQKINLSFYEVAMCHSLLLTHYGQSHMDVKLLKTHPTSTKNLIELFYG